MDVFNPDLNFKYYALKSNMELLYVWSISNIVCVIFLVFCV